MHTSIDFKSFKLCWDKIAINRDISIFPFKKKTSPKRPLDLNWNWKFPGVIMMMAGGLFFTFTSMGFSCIYVLRDGNQFLLVRSVFCEIGLWVWNMKKENVRLLSTKKCVQIFNGIVCVWKFWENLFYSSIGVSLLSSHP